jgi:hypothetical protein
MAATIESLAEEMYALVSDCAGKRNLKAGDLTKETIARHGADGDKDASKQAIRTPIDSRRGIYS